MNLGSLGGAEAVQRVGQGGEPVLQREGEEERVVLQRVDLE